MKGEKSYLRLPIYQKLLNRKWKRTKGTDQSEIKSMRRCNIEAEKQCPKCRKVEDNVQNAEK